MRWCLSPPDRAGDQGSPNCSGVVGMQVLPAGRPLELPHPACAVVALEEAQPVRRAVRPCHRGDVLNDLPTVVDDLVTDPDALLQGGSFGGGTATGLVRPRDSRALLRDTIRPSGTRRQAIGGRLVRCARAVVDRCRQATPGHRSLSAARSRPRPLHPAVLGRLCRHG